jgi:hypothetical protein
MMDRVYGVKNTDSGYESGYLNLNFTKPNPIHTIKATVSSESFQCVGCNANPSSYSWVSAYIQGYFFNTDDSSIPGDQTNDVRARLGIDASTNTSDQPSELRVVAKVQKCNNSDCTDITTMFTQDLGALALGQQAKLYLKWDKPNYRFLFRRDFEPWVSYAYDSNLQKSVPGINIKRLTVAGNAANCKAAPRTVAMMNAFFDNIYINN